jgi:cytochrome c-type biogenesis protein CcmH/NrfF
MRATLLLVLLLGLAGAAAAAEPPWSAQLERELMSPYCPGRSLVECPSQKATELRLWIQGQEREGVPRAQVEQELIRRYGDTLRHAPRAEGFGLWAYLVPAATLLAGGALVAVFLRRQAVPRAPVQRSPGPRDAELERRLEEELRASP